MIAAGILFLFLGFILIVVGVLRLIFARTNWKMPVALVGGGVLSTMLSILLIQLGKGAGFDRVSVGIVLMIIGLVVSILGGWQGFWSPAGMIAGRLPVSGIKFILIGLLLFISGILVLTLSGADIDQMTANAPGLGMNGSSGMNWKIKHILDMRPHGFAGMRLGSFFLLLLVGGNVAGVIGMVLHEHADIKNLLRVNVVLLAGIFLIFGAFYLQSFG